MSRPRAADDPSLGETIDAALGPTMVGEAAPMPHGSARFVEHAELGRGGMGRVLEATDTQFGRRVAVKELLQPSEASSARFAREALITGNLEHPGIPPVYERGEREGVPYYAMRRIGGRSLAEAIYSAKTLEERMTLLPAIIQVAHTLGFAHARGVVHRDVKPDNIMLGEHGEVVLLDWGIAKVRSSKADDELEGLVSGRSGSAEMTRQGGIVGTPAYLAPEQALGQLDRIDERTDVFALGALLYHVIVGRSPYAELELPTLLQRAKEADYTRPREHVPAVPRRLEAIVEKAMARAPSERFPTAQALASALDEFLAGAALLSDRDWSGALSLGVGVLAATIVGVGGYFILRVAAPFAAQGMTAYGSFGLTGLSASLAWLARTPEGVTRFSRPLLAVAGATLLLGMAGACGGISLAMRGALDARGALNAHVILEGVYEALGLLVTSSILSGLQLLVWGWTCREHVSAAHVR